MSLPRARMNYTAVQLAGQSERSKKVGLFVVYACPRLGAAVGPSLTDRASPA